MMKATLISIFMFLFIGFIHAVPVCQPSHENLNPAPIQVNLTISKRVFKVGEPISLRVEIANLSQKDVFVGRRVSIAGNRIYGLKVEVRDTKGRESPALTEIVEWNEVLPSQTLEPDLSDLWVTLPPGFFYGTTIQLTPADFKFLGTPGTYRIRGRYHSEGVDSGASYNPLRLKGQEIGRLQVQNWNGETHSNAVEISITRQKSNPVFRQNSIRR